MSEHLTFSFSHLFELARELSISLDQSGRHSRIDHRVITLSDDTALERTSRVRPRAHDVGAERARERDPRFQGAFPNREAAAPAADAIGAPSAMDRRFDQGPPQPRRSPAGD